MHATGGVDSVPGLGLWPGLGPGPRWALAWRLLGRGQGGALAGLKMLLPWSSIRKHCQVQEEDEGGSAQHGPALLHSAVLTNAKVRP